MKKLLVVGCLTLSSSAFAGDPTRIVAAHGQSVVTGGDKKATRTRVLRDLQKNAVAQVVAQLGGPPEGSDGQVDSAVYDHAADFCVRVDAGREDLDLNILSLDAKIEVNVAAVRAALGDRAGKTRVTTRASKEASGRKRVLILATEQLGPHRIIGWTDYAFGFGHGGYHASSKTTAYQVTTDMGGIEAAFSDVLGSGGYDVIDPQVLHGKLAPRSAVSVLELGAAEARSIATKADADYVLIAKGVAKDAYHPTIAEGGMVSGQGNVVARLVRTKDGKVVGAATEHAASVHIDPDTAKLQAIDEAARLAGKTLLDRANAE